MVEGKNPQHRSVWYSILTICGTVCMCAIRMSTQNTQKPIVSSNKPDYVL